MKIQIVLLMALAMVAPCFGATYFDTDFDGTGFDPLLEDLDSAYVVGGGATYLNAPDRHYVRTVESNYNEVDFVARVTFTHPVGDYGNVYFGIGAGTPDSTYYGEPSYSAGVSHFSLDWHWMGCQFQSREVGDTYILREGVNKNNVEDFAAQPKTAVLVKSGNTLTIELHCGTDPANRFSFPIHEIADIAPFLDNTNSHIFFGCSDPGVIQFQSMSIEVPEPMTMSLLALGGLGLIRRRK